MVKYVLLIAFLIFSSCDYLPQKPEMEDGNYSINIIAKYADISSGDTLLVDSASVYLSSYDFDIPEISGITDDSGQVVFTNLITTEYNVSVKGIVKRPFINNPDSLINLSVLGYGNVIPGVSEGVDTIYTISSGAEPGLKINELYTVGSPNNFFYFFDQYIELYNSADETKYLDGMIFCRMSYGLCCVTYIFQFPGEPLIGREYPVEPGEFVILAGDAMNHITLESGTIKLPGSVDLSEADWEFKNSKDYGDWDNPDVPNIDNIEVGHTRDFLISLTSDVVLLADGSDLNYLDGIDVESVVDCVEYSSSSTHTKDIETSVDQGYGGIGLSKYSGQSLERIEPGFDSNNSTYDFEIIEAPTLWYHHE